MHNDAFSEEHCGNGGRQFSRVLSGVLDVVVPAADNAVGVIRIWTPPGLPVFVLISNLCTTAS
ncbi:hypothetical protein ACSEV8_29080, partial [Pseudomonas aeruginosa]